MDKTWTNGATPLQSIVAIADRAAEHYGSGINRSVAAPWVVKAWGAENHARGMAGKPFIPWHRFIDSLANTNRRKKLLVADKHFRHAFRQMQRG